MVGILRRALVPVAVVAAAAASSEVSAPSDATGEADYQKFMAPFAGDFRKYSQKGGERQAAADFKGYEQRFSRAFEGAAHKAEKDGEVADIQAQRKEAAEERRYVSKAKQDTLNEARAAKAEADKGTGEISSEMNNWFKNQFGPMSMVAEDAKAPPARAGKATANSRADDDAQAKLAAEMSKYYASQYAQGYTNMAGKDAQGATSAATADANAGLTEAQKAEQMQRKWASDFLPGGVSLEGQSNGPGANQKQMQKDQAERAAEIGRQFANQYAPAGVAGKIGSQFSAQQAKPAAGQPQSLEAVSAEPGEGGKPSAPESAADCHTVAELNAWRKAQTAQITKFIPKEYNHWALSSVEGQYKKNLARIHKELEAAKSTQPPAEESGPETEDPDLPAPPPLPKDWSGGASPPSLHDGPVRDGPARDGPARDGPSHDGSMSDGPSRDGPVRGEAAEDEQAPATDQLALVQSQEAPVKAQRLVELVALPAFLAASVFGIATIRRRRAARPEADMSVYLMQP